MNYTKFIYALFVVAFLAGCVRDTDPTPIREWDSVVHVFEGFLIRGQKDQIRIHSFIDGIPREHRAKADAFMAAWRGIPQRMRIQKTEVIEWSEYQERKSKTSKLYTDQLVANWKPIPDKIIIYHFQAGEAGQDGFARAEWSAGVYQRSDGWRFSARWLAESK